MEMNFRGTPERALNRKQERDRNEMSMDEVVHQYGKKAEELLSGPQGEAAKDELSRLGDGVLNSREGQERADAIERLENAFRLRHINALSELADEPRERDAFALALARQYKQSLQ